MSTSHKDRAVRALGWHRGPQGRWIPACLAAGVLATTAAADQPSFTGLGFLPTGYGSDVSGMSADGTVVVGNSNGANWQRPMRWTFAGGMESLGFPTGATGAQTNAINSDGTILVGMIGFPSPAGWSVGRWQAGIGWQNLGRPSGQTWASASAISGDGSVVLGNSSLAGIAHRFRWSAETGMVLLTDFLGIAGFVDGNGLNSDGSVMVGADYSTPGPYRGFRKRDGETIEYLLAPAQWTNTVAQAISADGAVVSGWCNTNSVYHAAIWNAQGEMLDLGTLGTDYGAYGTTISTDGSFVGGISWAESRSRAFLWHRRSGMIDVQRYLQSYGLDLTGWTLWWTIAISSDGRTIAGNGTHNFRSEAWVATLGALPCGLADEFGVGGTPGPDGELTADDIIGFFAAFLAGQPAGDVGGIGGTRGSDGQFTADDVIVFLAAFFAGCE